MELSEAGRAGLTRDSLIPDASLVITQVEESNEKAATMEFTVQELRAEKELLIEQLEAANLKVKGLTDLAEQGDKRMEDVNKKLDAVRQELENRPTHSQLTDARKEVEMLKELVDTDIQLVDEDGDEFVARESTDESIITPRVDAALKEKARKASTEVTKYKHLLLESNQNLTATASSLEKVTSDLDAKTKLIAQLERDLVQATSLNGQALPDSEEAPVAGVITGSTAETSNAVLQIVCSQRERYKQRLAELEEVERHRKEKDDTEQREIEKLRSDNLALYEKIKYLESYQSQAREGAGVFDYTRNNRDIEASVGQVESQYRKQYEDSLNPFR